MQRRKICLALIVVLLLMTGIAAAGSDSTESQMAAALGQSVDTLEQIQIRGLTNAAFARLKALQEEIGILHLLLQDKFDRRETRVNAIDAAARRHDDMSSAYTRVVEAYLDIMEDMDQPADLDDSRVEKLIEILQTVRPQPAPPIFGALPYTRLNYAALKPQADTTVVPAYLDAQAIVNPADTAPSAHAPKTAAIAELAESLDWNPVRIYEWVKNNVKSEYYWGSMKGARETLRQKSGNAADQAALLVALMRAADYPSRYVRGIIAFHPDISAAHEYFGVSGDMELLQLLRHAGIPHEVKFAGQQIDRLYIEHIWVETQVPYANYRGAAIDAHGKIWIGLDTSFKTAGFERAGAHAAVSQLQLAPVGDLYRSAAREESPLDFLRQKVENQLETLAPGTGYDDLLATCSRKAEHLNILPPSLQFKPVQITAEYTQLPQELVHSVNFRAQSEDGHIFYDQTIPTARLSNQAVVLTFEPRTVEDQEIINAFGGLDNTPSYLIRLRPVIQVAGERQIIGSGGLASGERFVQTITLKGPNGQRQFANTHITGNLTLINIVAQQAVSPAPMDAEQKDAVRLLHETAAAYTGAWNDGEAQLADLLDLKVIRPMPTVVTVGGVMEVTRLIDQTHDITWKGVFVDADFRAIETTGGLDFDDGGDARTLFMQLSALQGSYLESRILEEQFQVDSVSTAQVLGLAADRQIELLRIDKDNIDTVLPGLPLADNLARDIADAVNQNLTVQIPAQPLIFEEWTGIGYIKENPDTGEAGYMLSGMIAGGMTAWGADRWSDYFRNRMTYTYAGETNNDPSAATQIVKITATDMQQGTAGQALKNPLQVVVRDAEGKPVAGARVAFVVKAGGGGFDQNGLVRLVVTSDSRGIASAPFILGAQTAANPTYWWEPSFTHPQQVGENIVSARLIAADFELAVPFTAYGFPGEPTLLWLSTPWVGGHMLGVAGVLKAEVKDQYGNALANQLVSFSVLDPVELDPFVDFVNSCPNQNTPDRLPTLLFDLNDPCMDDGVAYYDQCSSADSFKQALSSTEGAMVYIMAGDLPAYRIPLRATLSNGLSDEMYIFHFPYGNCGLSTGGPEFKLILNNSTLSDSQGNNINAAEPGDTIPIFVNMTVLREGGRTGYYTHLMCDPDVTCPTTLGNDQFTLEIEYPDATLDFNGQQGTYLGNSQYRFEHTLQPGVNTIPVNGQATYLIDGYRVDHCDTGCVPVTYAREVNQRIFVTVYGVTIDTDTRIDVAVDEAGRATCDIPVTYDIQPQEYKTTNAYLLIYRDAELIAAIPTQGQGQGTATIGRGFQFDDGVPYTAEIVLNPNSDVEIKSDTIALVPDAVEVERLEIVDYKNKGCLVPLGGRRKIRALTHPENRRVVWSITERETIDGQEVKAEIRTLSDTIGNIEAAEDSASGWITVRATDEDNPCVYKEARVYIGCQTCEDGECDTLPGNGFVRLSSIDIGISLGPGQGGQAAGQLFIKAQAPDETLYTPEGLMLSTTTNDIEARYGDDHLLRQVMAHEALADIRVHASDVYSIDVYRAAAVTGEVDGLYQIDPAAQPLAVWTMSPYGQSGLKVNHYRDGKDREHIYQWDHQSGTWILSKANGSQVHSLVEEKNGDDRIVTRTLKDAFNNIASKTRVTYRTFDWGEAVIESVSDPDGAALTTTSEYYLDEEDAGSYGRIARQVNPDGSWTRYAYDQQGRRTAEITPWLDAGADADAADARVTAYDYTPVDPADSNAAGDTHRPRTVTQTIAGQVVSRTYYACIIDADGTRTEITERCAAADAAYGDSANQRTVTAYYPSDTGEVESGRIKSTVHPDGRMDSYAYDTGNYLEGDQPGTFIPLVGDDVRTMVVHGTVDQPDGVAHKTTRDVTIASSLGRTLLQTTDVYDGSGYERIHWTFNQYNDDGRVIAVRSADGRLAQSSWSCCGKTSETDATGQTTFYTYDDLNRVLTRTREGTTGGAYPAQSDIQTNYTYDALGRAIETTVTAGTLSQTTRSRYDRAGRLQTGIDAAGLETTYAYSTDNRNTTVTAPGGAVQTTTRHLDGRTASVTGTAAVAQYYSYGVNADGSQWTEVRTGAADSPMFQRTTTDMLGRTILTEKQGPTGMETTRNFYDARGRLIRIATDGRADTLYVHDALGNVIQSGLDINADGALEPASVDRISASETVYTEINGQWWQQTTNQVYPTANDGTPVTVSIRRTQLSGLADDNQAAETVAVDIHGNITTTSSVIDRAAKTVTQTVDYPDSSVDARTISVNGLTVQSRTKTNRTTTFGYDALGRRISTTDPRTGTSATHYDTKGRVGYLQDAAGNTTVFGYDDQSGRRISQSDALGKVTRLAYNSRGQVTRTWGDGPYPVRYAYDDYGRMTGMTTYRTEAGFDAETFPETAAGDVTRWHYDQATGLLQAKEYADGTQVTYTYTTGGKLATRTWARQDGGQPLTTTYSYDPATGELLLIDYADATADITFAYDRLGRQTEISDAAGTRTFAYNPALQLESETIAGIYDAAITRTYASAGVIGRSSGLTLGAGYHITYGYDTAGRFNTLAWNAAGQSGSGTYSYVPDADLIQGFATASGVQTTYGYEPQRNLKTSVQNRFDSTTISQYDYVYDPLGRRSSAANTGSAFAQAAFSRYGYNDRSELINAGRYLGADVNDTANPVTAEQRAYLYDPIGNRTRAEAAAAPVDYLTNELNQYTDIGGALPVYDDDGNMTATADGRIYTYNAENRLIAAAPQTPAQGDTRTEYVYDYMGRRVQKIVSTWQTDHWSPITEHLYLYDGWNLIKETTAPAGQSAVDTYYVWGLDLSQSLQGAGGVGGLVASVQGSLTYHYLCDANGNVGQVVDAADGLIAAHYEYDPYGNLVNQSGAYADENPYRFSTKYFDKETNLYYYGYRYYAPELGRWINKDPIGEEGGISLYGFINNNPIRLHDLLGLKHKLCADEMCKWRKDMMEQAIAKRDRISAELAKAYLDSSFEDELRAADEYHKLVLANEENFPENELMNAAIKAWDAEVAYHNHLYQNKKMAIELLKAMKREKEFTRYYMECYNKYNCYCESFYCRSLSGRIGVGLDVVSIGLVVSGAGSVPAGVTYGLSIANSVIYGFVCDKVATPAASATLNTFGYIATTKSIVSKAPVVGPAVGVTLTTIDIFLNAGDIFEP